MPTGPLAAPAPNLAAMFDAAARAHPGDVAYKFRPAPHGGTGDDNAFITLSLEQAHDRVRALASGLLADCPALAPGDRVAIVASTRVEWILFDYAALSLGLVTVPIYPSLLPAEIGFVLQDAGVKGVVVEDDAQLEKLAAIKGGFTFDGQDFDETALAALERIWVMDPADGAALDAVSLPLLEDKGRRARAQHEAALADRLHHATRDDLATLIYTSGTTGRPKGVLISHGNALAMVEATAELGFFKEELRSSGGFCFLPLAHAFGRMLELGAPFYAATLILSSPDTLLPDLQATRPGFVPAAPRVFEKIHARVMAGVEQTSPLMRTLFHWSLDKGDRARAAREDGRTLGAWDRALHAIADKAVLARFRQRLGLDRCQILLSGSAPLADEIQRFFGAFGLPIYEAYGMTEAIPGLSSNRPGHLKRGTVGQALPGVDFRVADDGELLAKGPNISAGYHGRPDDTSATFDDDGWLHTGDIGVLDEDGFITITDRKKNLIKTSGGKYVAPQKLEGLLKAQPIVEDAVLVGDRRKYCVALLVVDQDVLGGAPEVSADGEVDEALSARLQRAVDAVNDQVASFESIKQWRVLPEVPTADNGLLTPSFKIKRKAVEARYQALIDAMYPDG